MAVYTEVTDEALASFIAEYELGTVVAFRGIAEGVENSNFSLRTSAGDFILTLYEKRVDPAELPWFLGLMEHLVRGGITCPQPVRARDGAVAAAARRAAGLRDDVPAGRVAAPGAADALRSGGGCARGLAPRGCGLCRRTPERPRPRRLADRCWRAACPGRTRCSPVWPGSWRRCTGPHPRHLARSLAARPHPRRSVPGQRVLPGRAVVRPDRLLFRRDGSVCL